MRLPARGGEATGVGQFSVLGDRVANHAVDGPVGIVRGRCSGVLAPELAPVLAPVVVPVEVPLVPVLVPAVGLADALADALAVGLASMVVPVACRTCGGSRRSRGAGTCRVPWWFRLVPLVLVIAPVVNVVVPDVFVVIPVLYPAVEVVVPAVEAVVGCGGSRGPSSDYASSVGGRTVAPVSLPTSLLSRQVP